MDDLLDPAGVPIESRSSITRSFAPPWSGPFRVPIALVTELYRSLSVDAVTRAANVEALSS